MQCIDAIEGAVKAVLAKLHDLAGEHRLDDSEYIRNVRSVLEGVEDFLRLNQEIVIAPGMLEKVLYEHARGLWMASRENRPASSAAAPETDEPDPETADYGEYYFDHIYRHGTYPR